MLGGMDNRISAATRGLLTLSLFFLCATLGAGLALFTGWPVAILSGIVGFVGIQQVMAVFARRRDKRAAAKEFAHLRKLHHGAGNLRPGHPRPSG